MVLAGLVKRMATRYVITTERLHIRRGILSKATQETRIQRVQNVNTDQSFFERILRVGTVDFDTAGTDDSEFRFVGVGNPARWCAAVDRAQRQSASEQQPDRSLDAAAAQTGGGGSRPGRAGAPPRARHGLAGPLGLRDLAIQAVLLELKALDLQRRGIGGEVARARSRAPATRCARSSAPAGSACPGCSRCSAR